MKYKEYNVLKIKPEKINKKLKLSKNYQLFNKRHNEFINYNIYTIFFA